MLSDEEKEAIEYWKTHMEILHWNTQLASEHYIKVLLDLIKKQSKEIEELKEKEKNLLIQLKDSEKELLEVCEKLRNSVSKDKIKAKIEEVDIQLQKLKDGLTGRKTNFVNKNMLFAQKKALESLLEKENI